MAEFDFSEKLALGSACCFVVLAAAWMILGELLQASIMGIATALTSVSFLLLRRERKSGKRPPSRPFGRIRK